MEMPYISYFLVHDITTTTVGFPINYYFEVMSKLACANYVIFVEAKEKYGKTMFELFIETLLNILKEHSPSAAEDAEILVKEVQEEFEKSKNAIDKEFDYSALMDSVIYYKDPVV